jgi:hypothetical protein
MTYGRFLEYLEMGWVKQVDYTTTVEMLLFKPLVHLEIDLSQSEWKYLWVLHHPKVEEYNINFDAHPAPQYFHNNR